MAADPSLHQLTNKVRHSEAKSSSKIQRAEAAQTRRVIPLLIQKAVESILQQIKSSEVSSNINHRTAVHDWIGRMKPQIENSSRRHIDLEPIQYFFQPVLRAKRERPSSHTVNWC